MLSIRIARQTPLLTRELADGPHKPHPSKAWGALPGSGPGSLSSLHPLRLRGKDTDKAAAWHSQQKMLKTKTYKGAVKLK